MLESKHTSLLFLVAAVAASVARVFYLTETVNAQTGFLDDRMGMIGLTLILFIFFCALLPAVCGRLTEDRNAGVPALCGTLGSLLMILLAVSLAFDLSRNTVGIAWQQYLLWGLGYAAALVLAAMGIASLFGARLTPVLWAVPVSYMVMQVMTLFTAYTSLVLISEHVLEMAELCLVLLFLLQWGKFQNGLGGRYTLAWACCFGYGAAVLCLSSSVSRLVLTLTGREAFLHGEYPLNVCEPLLAVWIVVMLLRAYRARLIKE